MNAVHYFSFTSFLVSTLSGIVAGFVRLAAFLFIGIKVRPPLREDGLLLFMEVFMTLQITGDAKEIAELIEMLQIQKAENLIRLLRQTTSKKYL